MKLDIGSYFILSVIIITYLRFNEKNKIKRKVPINNLNFIKGYQKLN